MKQQQGRNTTGGHGGGIRGEGVSRRSSSFEGRFGRMFRELPAASWPESALRSLGEEMTAEPEHAKHDKSLPAAALETKDILQDDEENAGIPAGYTYFGQFVDHDITFDPASSLQQQNDPDGLVDFRTPRLDLDCLYGRGPADQPYMYDGHKFRFGVALTELDAASSARDLPRYAGVENPPLPQRALIGDKRNDENVIVSQLHSAMLQFHNKFVDLSPRAGFEETQRQVRWHYQWLVVNDYLVRICGKEVIDAILPKRLVSAPIDQKQPQLLFYRKRNDAFMPIEFSVAAYRFGHSMVRPIYRLNTRLKGGENPLKATPDEIKRGIAGRFFIFAGLPQRGLNGFDAFPTQWAIDWSLFFDIDGSGKKGGINRVQPSYKIDTSLVNPLGFLPEFSMVNNKPPLTVDSLQAKPKDKLRDPANLAQRNLLRGMAMGLPSGQAIADAMGVARVPEDKLWIGKAVFKDLPKSKTLSQLDPSFANNAPLWYYVLAEAQYEWRLQAKDDATPLTLGSVGKRIVAETIIGLLWADGHSYLRQAPNFTPTLLGGNQATVGSLLKFALS